MAALLLLLAIVGAAVVGDLVLENTATGAITVLDRPVTSYSHGLLLAMAAAIGFVVALLVVGSVSLRRSRWVRRKQRTAERELRGQLLELEDENTRLHEELARQELVRRRLSGVAAAADLDTAATARQVPPPPADSREEPVYAEARRAARFRSDADLSSPSSHR